MGSDLLPQLNAAERKTDNANIRPKDAATLLILRRQNAGEPKVLMGRRHERHRFMPGKFVFPGGRVDPSDSRVALSGSFDPTVHQKLMYRMKQPRSEARARALAIAAIRETYEEAGLFIGKSTGKHWKAPSPMQPFAERGIELDLSPVRLIARAITPPRRPRRFDTRFLAVFEDTIADSLPEKTGPSGELEDLHWIALDDAHRLELPSITMTIIEELRQRLSADPDLSPNTPVPYYYWQRKGFVREEI
ncbi:MAG: NUDIX hydrolase [Stappiaceae bacterium]